MTTTDSSFVAQGALSGLGSYPIGFYANSKGPRPIKAFPPFQVGTLAVGQAAGVYGATDTVALPPPGKSPPGVSDWGTAGVWGYSVNTSGVAGYAAGVLPSSQGLPAAGVLGVSDNYYGVFGYAPGNPYPGYGTITGGVYGVSGSGFGVRGSSDQGYGVYGESGSDAYGVYGTSWNNHGVRGDSINSSGVVGLAGTQSLPVLSPNTAGVFGIAGLLGPQLSQAPQQGNTIKPPTAGVFGTADQHPGVIGTSNAGIGVYGFSTVNSGVMGESVSSWAGYFAGNVNITGNLTVAGPMKGAVVPFPDGTQRVLLCMESPEAWFEDFGAGKLKRGRAAVKIDRDFAKVIKRGDYHVFLTPRGDCRGLYVRRQGGASFEVREFGGGASSVAFSYRIIGRRKDVKGHRRFAKIDTRLRMPVPRARPARRTKLPPRTPAALRAFAARMEKETRAQMAKRGRQRKGSDR
jgi:hypothetical protein